MRVIRPNHYAPDSVQEPAEHFTYDAFHNRLSRTDETGAVFAMHRDGEGNITKEINPNFYHPGEKDGTGIEYRYDADDRSVFPSTRTGEKSGAGMTLPEILKILIKGGSKIAQNCGKYAL